MNDRLLIQMDDRGRITLPSELRSEWNLEPGDYIAIDVKEKNIDRANIITDEELKNPEIIKAILELGEKAKEEYCNNETVNLEEYVAESEENEYWSSHYQKCKEGLR